MKVNLHDEVRSNKRKSILIVVLFFVFVGFIGGFAGLVFGGFSSGVMSLGSFLVGLVLATVLAIVYLLIFMRQGDNMILSSTGAVEANREKYPFLFHTTESLSLAAGMSKPPKCYVINDPSLNAYATGLRSEKSYIVVTTGLIEKLNREELEGVLAHEMSHIKNQDVKVMILAAGLVGVTVLLADIMFRMFLFNGHGSGDSKDNRLMIFIFVFWLALIILSPLVANMIKMAISRQREYLADSNGALLTRYPEGLASALEKIKGDSTSLKNASEATAHLFISNPFRGKKKPFIAGLFSTHPPIDKRIEKLRGKE